LNQKTRRQQRKYFSTLHTNKPGGPVVRAGISTFVIAEFYSFIDLEELKLGFALQHRPSFEEGRG
jgi:hypothetical protein